MASGSTGPSSRKSLSPQQALEHANVCLQNALNAKDPDIARVHCHDAEVSLSQAKKDANQTDDQTVTKGIATAYIDLGNLLESLDRARAKKLGYAHEPRFAEFSRHSGPMQSFSGSSRSLMRSQDDSSKHAFTLEQRPQRGEDTTVLGHIFDVNVRPPTIKIKLPDADETLDSTLQLVYCLSLLKTTHSPDDMLDPVAQKWLQDTKKNTDEYERLHGMAIDVIEEFKRDERKDAKAVAEVVCLTPVLDKKAFQGLLEGFYTGIERSSSLNVHQIEGLAQLVQGADPAYLVGKDLVKLLELLNTRLMETPQAPQHMQLTLAVSHVLDAIADTNVTGLDRNELHEALSSYIEGLKKSSDPFLVYHAAYAHQALLCATDDKTTWQAAMRHTGKVIQGIPTLANVKNGLDLTEFIHALDGIHQKDFPGALNDVGAVTSTCGRVTSFAESDRSLLESLKENLCSDCKRDWYAALRGADILIRDGELATFKRLVCEAPCRLDPAFLWGVCQRLGEMAANPIWDDNTRQSAVAFLGEIYRDDEAWGRHAIVKQWILNILMQLFSSSWDASNVHASVAGTLLRELVSIQDVEKSALCQAWKEKGPTCYPLNVTLPDIASPSLIDRVQRRPDVEGKIRVIKENRTRERKSDVYIPPRARSGMQAASGSPFSLMDKVKEFLDSDQKVFLILGDSGAGKSTFCRQLERELWQDYKEGTGRIPLHINLPTFDKPEHDMIFKRLKRADFSDQQIQELKHHRKFILICDGYDECRQTHNLYTSNRLNQPGEWDVQMVISCRSTYIGSDYRYRFQPGDRNQKSGSPLLQEAVLAPFSTDQVEDYINQFVCIREPHWKAEDYKQALDLNPDLMELVKKPYWMALTLDVLPCMVDPGNDLSKKSASRVLLLDHFVEQWLERSKKRLGEKEMNPQERTAFEKLSAEGFTSNGIRYIKMFATAIYKEQDGHPVVKYSQPVDRGTWKDNLLGPIEMQLLYEACPLSRDGHRYQFIHRSLLEYGLARAVYDPQGTRDRSSSSMRMPSMDSSTDHIWSLGFSSEPKYMAVMVDEEPDLESPLMWRNFENDHFVVQLLAERAHEPMFKEQLLSYIEYSKKNKEWCTAAANAITILVRGGEQFIGTDLRGIRIPGADLSYGVFDSVQFQGADMRDVKLRGAWLRETNLRNADLTGVRFDELLCLRDDSSVVSCAYSADGKLFAVGLEQGNIKVYLTSNWKRIWTLKGHTSSVSSVTFSLDGDRIASASSDKSIRLWEVGSGACAHVVTDHSGAANCVAYSPQGDQLVSASDDKTLRLRDSVTGCRRWILSGHEKGVRCVAYSPKGNLIASGGDDATVRLWNVGNGLCIHILRDHQTDACLLGVCSIAFSPQGDQVASSGSDNTIRIWNIVTAECSKVLSGHGNRVMSVAYFRNGDQVASGSLDGTLRVWDVKSGECQHTWTGLSTPINCVASSPNGDLIAFGDSGGTVRLLDLSVETSRPIQEAVAEVHYSPKGVLVASCTHASSTIRHLDAETGLHRKTTTVGGSIGGTVYSTASSPRGNQICLGCTNNDILLWDVETRNVEKTLTGHTGMIYNVAYSPEGDRIASSSEEDQGSVFKIWDTKTGELHHSLLLIGVKSIKKIAISTDGELLAVGSVNGSIYLLCDRTWLDTITWDAPKDRDSDVSSLVFSGVWLASGRKDWTVGLWNTQTRTLKVLKGHGHVVLCVAFSPKGILASGSLDRTVRLWDVESGQCRRVIQNIQEGVTSITWSTTLDVNELFTGCQDGTVLKWQVVEGKSYDVHLRWGATSASLNVAGASIRGVNGLNRLNKELLWERGATGGLDYLLYKVKEKTLVLIPRKIPLGDILRKMDTALYWLVVGSSYAFIAVLVILLALRLLGLAWTVCVNILSLVYNEIKSYF
ncbi:MAG: WD40-repeat-containing domain protein [Benniella sp.]|nr:MAG: WD40-repeat-containing domain protein [Benniella sp.]